MISLDSVEKSIIELEAGDTSFAACQRLAWLYIVRDHLRGYNVSPEAVIASRTSSDFMQAVNGKNPDNIWPIIDELVEVVRSLHPKLYDTLMERVKAS